jgi:hypothetical protein
MVGKATHPSGVPAEAQRRAGRRVVVGLALACAGAVVMAVAPLGLFAGGLGGAPGLLLALLAVEAVGIGLLWYGLSTAERGYRLENVPLSPPDRSEVERRTRRSWLIWIVGLLTFLSGAYTAASIRAQAGLGLVLVGLALFLYSFFVYFGALGFERARKTAPHDPP